MKIRVKIDELPRGYRHRISQKIGVVVDFVSTSEGEKAIVVIGKDIVPIKLSELEVIDNLQ